MLATNYVDYAKWRTDGRILDEILAPDSPNDPETPATPATGISLPKWSSRFSDRLVDV